MSKNKRKASTSKQLADVAAGAPVAPRRSKKKATAAVSAQVEDSVALAAIEEEDDQPVQYDLRDEAVGKKIVKRKAAKKSRSQVAKKKRGKDKSSRTKTSVVWVMFDDIGVSVFFFPPNFFSLTRL